MIVDVNQMLIGFVSGFAAGIFVAYKLAQRMKSSPPSQSRPREWSGIKISEEDKIVEPDQIMWRKQK